MHVLIIATICVSAFSVLTPIQSESIYVYNYGNNFGDFFPQNNLADFNIQEYKYIDNLFKEKYEGTNIGGAFQTAVDGPDVFTPWFNGFALEISVSVYCGRPQTYSKGISIYYRDGTYGAFYPCYEKNAIGWNTYNTYNTYAFKDLSMVSGGFRLKIESSNSTINEPFGFDEIRITVVDERPKTTTAIPQSTTNPPTTTTP